MIKLLYVGEFCTGPPLDKNMLIAISGDDDGTVFGVNTLLLLIIKLVNILPSTMTVVPYLRTQTNVAYD